MVQIINDMNFKIRNNEIRNETITSVISYQADDCDSLLNITNEEELTELDTKLLEKNFKTNVINYLKLLTRKTLTSKVCQLLRKYFDGELLKEYSYMGQKKRIFSSLKTCTIIFEAVNRTNNFENSIVAKIESPI